MDGFGRLLERLRTASGVLYLQSICSGCYVSNPPIHKLKHKQFAQFIQRAISEPAAATPSKSLRQFSALYLILAEDMEHQRLWVAVVVAMTMMVLPFKCLATDYTVGDSAQWNLGVNYNIWASGKTFAVGDKLVFKYTPGTHTVLVVNKAAYDSCLTTNPLATHTSGNDTITLDSTGAKYYICGISGHCSAGMKVTVTVGAASTSKKNGIAPSPSASRSPSSSVPPTTPTVQSPSPSSPAPTALTVGSPSPSSTAPRTATVGTPSPSSAATPTAVSTPSSSTNGVSTASPSYIMGAALVGGSLLFAMAWL